MRIIISGIWFLLASIFSYADVYLRQPAVDVVHYDIELELGDASDSIRGTARISVRMLQDGVSGMRLDFAGMQVDSLRIQGIPGHYARHGEGLSLDFGRSYARGETAIIAIRYHGRPERGLLIGNNAHGRRVFFSENWPNNAHYWFPCIDHPSDKAAVQVTVTAPRRFHVVSNGTLIQTLLLANGSKRTRWAERKPIPTYCIAVGAAEFSVARQPRVNGVPLIRYSYPEDAAVAARSLEKAASALDYFASLIGPYPYEKLAQVQAAANFDGMENASAIFYKESLFSETPGNKVPVVHEIAHQWFGNSVTQIDWDQLWLSEGFATYLEALHGEHMAGPGSIRQTMAEHAKNLFLSEPARSRPVIDPSQTDLMQKLNLLNYQKGAWVLHMLRGVLGDAAFFRGIRRYYRLYTGGNASSEDFRKAMESVSGVPLENFFRQWLHQPGWPEYRLSWRWDRESGEIETKIEQRQTTGLFDMPVDVVFEMERGRESRKLRVYEADQTFRILLPSEPVSMELDPNGWLLKSVISGKE